MLMKERRGRDWYLSVMIAFLVAIAVFGYLYWFKFDGQITGFFRIGSELALSPYLDPEQTLIYPGELGYDGQQFLSIALDPGLTNPDSVAALDHPAYRYRRIFYPLLGYCLGLGNAAWIPWALVLMNVTAIAIGTGLIGLLLPPTVSPFNALGVLAIPGVWMVLSLSTADLLASVWGLGAILCWQKHRIGGMALCLGGGLLTRETLLVIGVALVLSQYRRRQWSAIAAVGVSLVPLISWLGVIRWRQLPGGSGSGNFGWPLVGIGEKFQALVSNGVTGSNLYEAYLWALLTIGLGLLLWTRGRGIFAPRREIEVTKEGLTGLTISYASWLYVGLWLVASFYILNYYLNYSRVFLDIFLFCLLIPPPYAGAKKGFFLACGLASLAFLGLQS
ncbi:MAG: hypothetical protein VKJ27_09720 [Synechocystis sp.]|nr:hypothetical protein [Synechocystis sp.]